MIHFLFILTYYVCILLLICICCVGLYKWCEVSSQNLVDMHAGVKKRVGEEIDIDRILIFTTFMLRQPRMRFEG